MAQVLTNLLDNSLCYTDAPGRIRLLVAADAAGIPHVAVAADPSGAGLFAGPAARQRASGPA